MTTKAKAADEQPDTGTTRPRNVVEAIVAVMRDVKAVGKDGRNTQSNYNFRGIDGTVNALGPAMRRHGLVCMPRGIKQFEYGEIEIGKNRTKQAHVRVVMIYRFVYSNDDGEISDLEVEVPGEAMDSGDKATAKAMSVALRTNLLQSFALPTEDRDPDEDTYERSPSGITGDDIRREVGKARETADPAGYLIGYGNSHGADVLARVPVTTPGQDGKPSQTIPGDEYLNLWIDHFRQAAAKAQRPADPDASQVPAQQGRRSDADVDQDNRHQAEDSARAALHEHQGRPAERSTGPTGDDPWTTPPAVDWDTFTPDASGRAAWDAAAVSDLEHLLPVWQAAVKNGLMNDPITMQVPPAWAAVVSMTGRQFTVGQWLQAVKTHLEKDQTPVSQLAAHAHANA